MPDPRPEVLDFLLTRRSRPAKTLAAPAPDREMLTRILTAAARSPDHGKLEPWRFIVL
ncbi:nitroreductase family protein, partial [Rhodovulum sulfidophilum]